SDLDTSSNTSSSDSSNTSSSDSSDFESELSKSSAMPRDIPLDETIRKVLLSELKLIFPERFSHESNPIMSKQIVAPIEAELVSQNNTHSASKDSSSDESRFK
ncbi:5084_t:CDS:2, partial [Dentiscutata erythropus]